MQGAVIALAFTFHLSPLTLQAQAPLKVRPDALPPVQEPCDAKALEMAATVDEMASWDRYPTYETYLAMMQQWATDYPDICDLDTIGTSVQGRLILAAHIEGQRDLDLYRPQFFYSSTIHGDEVTGYVMLLHLIDTLLASYGTSQRLTDLVNETAIYINPLANPDGTYRTGNHTVQGSVRYNADGIDLNRRFPDPFGPNNYAIPQENQAMIDYVSAHSFKLSANLHGGSEVMNYPWDCYTSASNPHPQSDWWIAVGQRFVDSARAADSHRFRDVAGSGVIAGGDWYVIHGGRQDNMNYYHGCLEMTMEVSTVKTLPSNQLPHYWQVLATPLINYMAEIHSLPGGVGIPASDLQHQATLTVYPNPTSGMLHIEGLPEGTPVELFDAAGRIVVKGSEPGTIQDIKKSELRIPNSEPQGAYILRAGAQTATVIKN